MKEHLLELDALQINFSAGGMHAINIVLAFVMFGVALGIKTSSFKKLAKQPKPIIAGLFSQLIALPALTFGLIVLLNLHITPTIAMGMILVASCPGGNISNFITQLSKSNTELSVSLTGFTTLMAVVSTPLNFAFWGGLYVKYVNTDAGMALRDLNIDVMQMAETVFLLLGIPLIVGMLTSRYLPKIAQKLQKPMQYFSVAFLLLMLVLAFGNNLNIFLKYLYYIVLIVLFHNALALISGYGVGAAFGLKRVDRRTLSIETGIQNSGLGLVLLFNPKIFPPDLAIGGMVFITAWWGIWHIISGLSIAFFYSKKRIN